MPRERWRDRRAARRVRAGQGEPLARFRWWQLLSRSLFTLTLHEPDGTAAVYAVDVRHLGDRHDGEVRARLYRDGSRITYSRLPARFPVPGGHIEVATSSYGLRRCHYVAADGAESQLAPHPATAEGRRLGLQRTHPRLSRLVGAASTLLVLVGVGVAVPQLIETLSLVPPLAEAFGTFDSPVDLAPAANVAVGIATVAASTERALRLRSNWLDDLAS